MNRVAALADIYAIFGRCSKELQNTQSFPWERREAFDRLTRTLQDMSCAIDPDEEFAGEHSADQLWPSLSSRDTSAVEVGYIILSPSKNTENRNKVAIIFIGHDVTLFSCLPFNPFSFLGISQV